MQLATDLRTWRLRDFHWASSGRGLILELDRAGNGQRWLAWLDLHSGAMTRLTPELAADAQYVGQVGGGKPSVLVAVRQPFAGGFELQAVTPTGVVLGQWQGPSPAVSRWLATGTQALAVCQHGDTTAWWHTNLSKPSWTCVMKVPAADSHTSQPVALGTESRTLFATSSVDRDTVALIQMSAPSWSPVMVHGLEQFDVTSVLLAPDGSGPDLVTSTDPGGPQTALTREAAADLARLELLARGAPARIVGRNDSHCLAEISYPVGGPAYVTFSRTTKAVSKPLVRYPGLERVRMQRREPFSFHARDGRMMTGFLTQPSGPPPWPAVLVVHGGPWSRDTASMDPWAQALAAAGFCCVQVNYRGSQGFGKSLREAGDKQWSLAMQDDLVDAVRSEPVTEVADPRRLAAMGHGFGGYAALMLATDSDVGLKCVISASAPTDLLRYVGSLLSLGSVAGTEYAARIGDPFDDRQHLIQASPVHRVAEITVPLLLFHGRRDQHVLVSHATGLADALRLTGNDYDLVIYEDEGHRYARPQNIADLQARSMRFLLTRLCTPVASAAG
jgi:acetyl esterase/lipase